MPLVGGFILAAVFIGVVVALSRSANANRGLPPVPGIPLPGDDSPLPSLPRVPVTDTVPPIPIKVPATTVDLPGTPPAVRAAMDALAQGTATPELLSAAIEAARKAGLGATAEALAKALDQLMLSAIPALVKAADKPGVPPRESKSGKPLWFVDVRGGQRMAIPNFTPVLIQFKALQAAIGGVKLDGRIGPKTLAAFTKKVSSLGFTKFPESVETLAANAVKWAEVLKKHFAPGQVGRPFDVPVRQWREFVARANSDWDKLAPRIQDKLGKYVGTSVEGEEITLSGLLGLVHRAGLRGAEQWLKHSEDRERFPNTTAAFRSTNGIF